MGFFNKYREVVRDVRSGIDTWILCLIGPNLTLAIYLLIVHVNDETTGKPMIQPDGWLEHVLTFIGAGLFIACFLAVTLALVTLMELGRRCVVLDVVASTFGFSKNRSDLRSIRRELAKVDARAFDLSTILDHIYSTDRLTVMAASLLDDPPWTVARWRTRRLLGQCSEARRNVVRYLTGDALINDIRHLLGNPTVDADTGRLVLVAVSGSVRSAGALCAIRRFRVAGADPCAWRSNVYDPGFIGDDPRYTTLVCVPQWLFDGGLAREACDLFRVSEAVPAEHIDLALAAQLWRSTPGHMYNDPARLAAAARRLYRRITTTPVGPINT